MKKEILDEPFRNSFSDFLEKGEKIIWQGQPEIKKTGSFPISPEDLFFSLINFFIQKIKLIGKSQKTEYTITSNRILFQLAHWKKDKIHDIHFSQIKNLLIVRDEENEIATIFLVIKNPTQINFDTYEILDNQKAEKRHQPTLENIKDIDEVTQLIRQGIKNANTPT